MNKYVKTTTDRWPIDINSAFPTQKYKIKINCASKNGQKVAQCYKILELSMKKLRKSEYVNNYA